MYQYIWYDKETRLIHLWDDKEGYHKFKFRKYAYKRSNKITDTKDIYGNYVEKIWHWKEGDQLLESDVYPDMRTLIDVYYEDESLPENNIVVFDIEVDVDKSFPDPKKAENTVTSIAVYDYTTNKYYCLILDEDDEVDDGINDNVEIKSYLYENDLLMDFVQLMKKLKPTILTGWNTDGFDIPYIINRMNRQLGQTYTNELSPIGKIIWDERWQKYYIIGINSLDYLEIYKKFTFSEERNYRLDTIAKKELGEGKIEFDGQLKDLFRSDINKYIEYNINDVRLVKKINDKKKLIDSVVTIATIGKIKYEDIQMSSRYIDGAILTYLKQNGLVAPNRVQGGERSPFIGAYVKEPIPNIYPFVYDLDLTSLYPSIIMSLNISPETKIAKVINWEYYKNHKDEDMNLEVYSYQLNRSTNMSIDKFNNMLDEFNFYISANGVVYKSKDQQLGIIPIVLNKWFNKRVEYKNLMKKYGKSGDKEKYEFYDKLQYAQKTLLNSVYGVLGLPSFRFYDLANAEAVTVTGRTIIKNAEQSANEYYNNITNENKDYVIAGDTDSLMLSLEPIMPKLTHTNFESNKSEIRNQITKVQEYINNGFDKLAKENFHIKDTHRFNIKQELISKNAIWLAKKRYGMLVIDREGIPENKLEIKGIDVVRSSFPLAFVGFLKKLLYEILDAKTKNQIDDMVLTFEKQLMKTDALDLCKNTSVNGINKYRSTQKMNKIFSKINKGTPAQVKAAIHYNDLVSFFGLTKKYSKITSGEKIVWCYLKKNKFGLEALACRGYEDPPEIIEIIEKYIDKQKMYESELKSKILQIYEALGWIYPSEQLKLSNQFFD